MDDADKKLENAVKHLNIGTLSIIKVCGSIKPVHFTVIEVHSTPVNNIDNYYGVMALEPVWAMSVRVGIMRLLNDSSAA